MKVTRAGAGAGPGAGAGAGAWGVSCRTRPDANKALCSSPELPLLTKTTAKALFTTTAHGNPDSTFYTCLTLVSFVFHFVLFVCTILY